MQVKIKEGNLVQWYYNAGQMLAIKILKSLPSLSNTCKEAASLHDEHICSM
jgi:hypothetical protein